MLYWGNIFWFWELWDFFSKCQFCPLTFLSDQLIRLINKKSNKENNYHNKKNALRKRKITSQIQNFWWLVKNLFLFFWTHLNILKISARSDLVQPKLFSYWSMVLQSISVKFNRHNKELYARAPQLSLKSKELWDSVIAHEHWNIDFDILPSGLTQFQYHLIN